MHFTAEIDIMPHRALLDPQGKAVTHSMAGIELPEITGVRMGKHIQLQVEAPDEATARQKVDQACQKMLVNPITEGYTFTLSRQEAASAAP